ncbi:dnaJ homolog subfamily C member 11 [Toxorhynchites rutilus septentrionalis]|uniref:dnaJ homolog subfamily C member 11 n=1 Tax=Toxorhynchites rutilus septentrionalis TaxID=329112 RepID=UPI002479B430|nr:dnaJ homolog subfamily C member 11 [Toxorhynchites rutilus septentrionalis]
MDDNEDLEYVEEDYYAFLNVPRNASQEEIISAYRNFSRIYHPDKHVDVSNKGKAETMFNRTKRAYEILSDPHQRAIYDSLGNKGLHAEGWELVHRTRTPAEIREEYERLAREREERRLQQKTNPRGNLTVQINATEIFSKSEDDYDEGGLFPAIEVSGMSMSQSIEAPMSRTDTVMLAGNLHLQNGVGGGNFMLSGRRLINKGWFEVDCGAGSGPVLGLKGSRNLTNRLFLSGGTTVNFRQNAIIPGIAGTLAMQLDKHTVGYLTYNAGLQSSMSTSIEHNTDRYHYNLSATLGIPHCYITASYTRKMVEQEMKLRVALKGGTFGFLAEYGAEKKVSKYSSVMATVSMGVPTGVILKIKIIRSSQTFLFPIHLSEEIIPAAIFYATITPLLTYFVLKKTIIDPMNEASKQRNIEKVKETNRTRMAEKRREAESAIALMGAMYERVRNEEQKRKGLIIVTALYGKFTENEKVSIEQRDEMGFIQHKQNVIDVKIPLQCLVKDSRLTLYGSTKSELPGFYDPCFGEDKLLQIDYEYRNKSFSVTVADSEDVMIPENGNGNSTQI